VNWAVDPNTGLNNSKSLREVVPRQALTSFLYWFRIVFYKSDFVYRDEKTGEEIQPGAGRHCCGLRLPQHLHLAPSWDETGIETSYPESRCEGTHAESDCVRDGQKEEKSGAVFVA
jgi:hypothetical protein